jgi:hypothetical protein
LKVCASDRDIFVFVTDYFEGSWKPQNERVIEPKEVKDAAKVKVAAPAGGK